MIVGRPIVAVEHQAIIDAIKARDAIASEQTVFDHVTAARERLVRRLWQQGILKSSNEKAL